MRASSMTARTRITADTLSHARAMLTRIYGENNVLGITQAMSEGEDVNEETKTLNAQELQVKSLADTAKRITQQRKQLQARQEMSKAQEKMRDASKSIT